MSYRNLVSTQVGVKRVRREMEPEAKPWHDQALEKPWDAIRIKPLLTQAAKDLQDAEDDEGFFDNNDDMRVTAFDEKEPRYSGRAIRDVLPFVLKNVFFFSHATEVQAIAVPLLRTPNTSVVVEAATGSGKTLAFLVPIFERILFSCHSSVLATGMPVLQRGIVAVVLSPSRMLASQTYVVAKKLSARLPFGIDAILCDRLVEPTSRVLDHLSRQRRGAGTVLITTPGDLAELLTIVFPHLASEGSSDSDNAAGSGAEDGSSSEEEDVIDMPAPIEEEEEDEHYKAAVALMEGSVSQGPSREVNHGTDKCFTHMRGDISVMRKMGAIPSSAGGVMTAADEAPLHQSEHGNLASASAALTALPFMLVVDEADVVLKAPMMRHQVETFTTLMRRVSGVDGTLTLGDEEENKDNTKCPGLDIGLFGATVGSSEHVNNFVSSYCPDAFDAQRVQDEADAAAASQDTAATSTPPPAKKGAKKETAAQKKKAAAAAKKAESTAVAAVTSQLPPPALHSVVLHSNADFISLLENKYVLTPTCDFLHTLVHLINLHPNKKHFVFFNSVPVLLFVKSVLEKLIGGRAMTGAAAAAAKKAESQSQLTAKKRRRHKQGQPMAFVMDEGEGGGAAGSSAPKVLYVPTIMTMHEDMSETTKFNEYNAFLAHDCGSGGASASAAGGGFTKARMLAHKRDKILAKEAGASASSGGAAAPRDKLVEDGQHFMGGLKRDQSHKSGTGAVLLCTDEAAFGLDVRDVDYVYHAELPRTRQAYVHRIGRVGRMGMRGQSVLILTGSGDSNSRTDDLDDDAGARRLAAKLGGVPDKKLNSTDSQSHTYNNGGSYRTVVSRRRGKFHNGQSMMRALDSIVNPAESGTSQRNSNYRPPASRGGGRGAAASDSDDEDADCSSSDDESDEEGEVEALKAVLSPKQFEFFMELQETRSMTRYYVPQVAPLTSTIRSCVWHKPGNPNIATTTIPALPTFVTTMGQPAAMALANFGQKARVGDVGTTTTTAEATEGGGVTEEAFSWYTPKAALEALLLSTLTTAPAPTRHN